MKFTARAHQNGFSLIVTITMMILLSLIAVGILSLSTVTLRSGQGSAGIQEARANARLALTIAIGRLQKLSGPDRAITASAGVGILDESSLAMSASSPTAALRNYVGVWEAAPNPRDERNKFFFPEPEYPSKGKLSNQSLFKGWLISNANLENIDSQDFFDNATSANSISFDSASSDSPQGASTAVYLVHAGSVDDESGYVRAGAVPIAQSNTNAKANSGGGRYAFWIGDNNQKFYLNPRDEKTRSDEDRQPGIEKANGGDHLVKMATPGPYGLETFSNLKPDDGGFSIEANSKETDRLITLKSLEFDNGPKVAKKNFHDLTPLADSLLVNVTSGVLRKDLSLFFEGEPVSGDWSGYKLKSEAPTGPYGQEALSNYDEYDTASWSLLRQYAKMGNAGQIIRSNRDSGNTVIVADARETGDYDDPEYAGWNRQRMTMNPVITRASMILSVGATDINRLNAKHFREPLSKGVFPPGYNGLRPVESPTSTPDNIRFDRNQYLLNFSAYPVVTLWNPYNVPMEVPGFSMQINGTGTQQIVTVDGANPTAFHWGLSGIKPDGSTQSRVAHRGIYYDSDFTLEPGESRTFAANITGTPYLSRALYFEAKPLRRPRDLDDLVTAGAPWNGGFLFNAPDKTDSADHDFKDVENENLRIFSMLGSTTGIFADSSSLIAIRSEEFVPAGPHNIDMEPGKLGHQGLLNYENYSSFDIGMYTSGNLDTSKLWFGYGRNAQSNKLASKLAWRMDEGNPVTIASDLGSGPFQVPPFQMSTITGGQRRPFMSIDLRLKSAESKNARTANPNCTWLHNIPQSSYTGITDHGNRRYSGGSVADSDIRTAALAHPYTMRFFDTPSFTEFFTTVHPVEKNGRYLIPFLGRSYHTQGGQHRMVAAEVPMAPLQSIAQLTHLPMRPIDATRWSNLGLQNMAIANSYANPLLKADSIAFPAKHPSPSNDSQWGGWKTWFDSEQLKTDPDWDGLPDLDGFRWVPNHSKEEPENHFTPMRFIDRSFVANTLLWDDFFFSGIADYESRFFSEIGGTSIKKDALISEFVKEGKQLPNATFRLNERGASSSEIVSQLEGEQGYQTLASYMKVAGGFNVNSLSVKAWKAFLASNLKKEIPVSQLNGEALDTTETSEPDRYAISRYSAPLETTGDSTTKWAEYNTIDDEQLTDLAEKIVGEVSQRGPFRSIAEFVNRRAEQDRSNPDFAIKGALQAALDRSTVNEKLMGSENMITSSDTSGTTYEFPEAAQQSQYAGSPEYIMQSDLLQSIGPAIQARGDCFIIRAYGESSDGQSRAWCEAQVARSIEYIDPSDPPELEFDKLSTTNQNFGRRYRLVSFRWLDPSEV